MVLVEGVKFFDQSERGWGVKYAREFDMTNDSKLFPPRPKWEEKGYQPDEYGHWLKGPWQAYSGPSNILDRPAGLVLSRDGRQALHVDRIEDVALPLYEGRMIGQFDSAEKGWVSGKGRAAVWRELGLDEKILEPQFLMGASIAVENGMLLEWKTPMLNIGSATNSRSVIAGLIRGFPCNHSLNPITFRDQDLTFSAPVALNSFVFDYDVRQRLGGLNLSFFLLDESVFPDPAQAVKLSGIGRALSACTVRAANAWLEGVDRSKAWRTHWAVTHHERLRLRVIADAVIAHLYGLSVDEYRHVLADCDRPTDDYRSRDTGFDPKGFWRVDRDRPPELRQTILSLVALHDLQQLGLDSFLSMNAGVGWLIPDQIRLSDYGLGRDSRAQAHQSVASQFGPRHLAWQQEDVRRSWLECEAHASLIRVLTPMVYESGDSSSCDQSEKPNSGNHQPGLF